MTARTLALATVATVVVATSLAAGGLIWMTATDPVSLAALTAADDFYTLVTAIMQRLIGLAW